MSHNRGNFRGPTGICIGSHSLGDIGMCQGDIGMCQLQPLFVEDCLLYNAGQTTIYSMARRFGKAKAMHGHMENGVYGGENASY